jgi:hypothetical protein
MRPLNDSIRRGFISSCCTCSSSSGTAAVGGGAQQQQWHGSRGAQQQQQQWQQQRSVSRTKADVRHTPFELSVELLATAPPSLNFSNAPPITTGTNVHEECAGDISA